ncbi:MAG: hypothetical protein ACOYK8_07920 [Alphaproteobacteria bacterium]
MPNFNTTLLCTTGLLLILNPLNVGVVLADDGTIPQTSPNQPASTPFTEKSTRTSIYEGIYTAPAIESASTLGINDAGDFSILPAFKAAMNSPNLLILHYPSDPVSDTWNVAQQIEQLSFTNVLPLQNDATKLQTNILTGITFKPSGLSKYAALGDFPLSASMGVEIKSPPVNDDQGAQKINPIEWGVRLGANAAIIGNAIAIEDETIQTNGRDIRNGNQTISVIDSQYVTYNTRFTSGIGWGLEGKVFFGNEHTRNVMPNNITWEVSASYNVNGGLSEQIDFKPMGQLAVSLPISRGCVDSHQDLTFKANTAFDGGIKIISEFSISGLSGNNNCSNNNTSTSPASSRFNKAAQANALETIPVSGPESLLESQQKNSPNAQEIASRLVPAKSKLFTLP